MIDFDYAASGVFYFNIFLSSFLTVYFICLIRYLGDDDD
jgi:hypothetical protein